MYAGVVLLLLALASLTFYAIHTKLNMGQYMLRLVYLFVCEHKPGTLFAKFKRSITLRIIGAYAYCRGWSINSDKPL